MMRMMGMAIALHHCLAHGALYVYNIQIVYHHF